MATFSYSSNRMRDALFLACQADFDRLKERVARDASNMMLEGTRNIIAQYGLRMDEARSDEKMHTEITITLIEPEAAKEK